MTTAHERKGTTRLLAGAVTAATTAAMPQYLFGALGPQIQEDLKFSHVEFGVAIAVFAGSATLASARLGSVADRLGATASLRWVSLGGAGVLGFLAGSTSYGWLVAGMLLGGIAMALSQPAANLAIQEGVDSNRRGWGFAVKQTGKPLATVVAGLSVPAIALTLGWRWAFVVVGALSLCAACLVPANIGGTKSKRRARGTGRPSMSVATLVVLAVAIGAGAGAANTAASFLVVAAVGEGISDSMAGVFLAVASGAVILVRLGLGWWSDRHPHGLLKIISAMLFVGAVGALLLCRGGGNLAFLIGSMLVMGVGWGWTGLFNFAVVRNNPEAPGAATGMTQTGTYAGVLILPPVFGWQMQAFSVSVAWITLAVLFAAAGLLMAVARALLLRDQKRAHPTGAEDP